MRFEGYYNSRSTAKGDLGHGWTHTYSAFLEKDIDVNGRTCIRITDATGQVHYFSNTSPYAGLFGEKTFLTYIFAEPPDATPAPPGGWDFDDSIDQFIWHRLDGTRYLFLATTLYQYDEDSNLIMIWDGAGNTLEMT